MWKLCMFPMFFSKYFLIIFLWYRIFILENVDTSQFCFPLNYYASLLRNVKIAKLKLKNVIRNWDYLYPPAERQRIQN